MKTLGIIPALFALGLLVIMQFGCSVIPQTQYVPEEATAWPDGTVSEPGTNVWVNEKGEGTATNTGKPLLVDDVEKVEKIIKNAKAKGEGLPAPVGWIAGALGTLTLGVGGAALRRRRRKQVEAAGGKKKS